MAKKKRGKSKAAFPETPTCNCVLLCDDVLISARGKHTLSGIIGTIASPTLPAVFGGIVAYVRLSNIYRIQRVRISLEGPNSDEPLFYFDAELSEEDPLGVHTIVAQIPPFFVREAGRYVFQVAADDKTILALTPIQIQGQSKSGESAEGPMS